MDFAKFSKTPLLLNTSGRVLQAIPEPFFMATYVLFYNAAEAVVQRCSVKKVFLEISQNWCFPVNFVKFIRTPFYKEHL